MNDVTVQNIIDELGFGLELRHGRVCRKFEGAPLFLKFLEILLRRKAAVFPRYLLFHVPLVGFVAVSSVSESVIIPCCSWFPASELLDISVLAPL